MEVVEQIADQSIPHAENMRAIYPYIPDIVSCLTLDDPVWMFIPNLIHVLLSTSCVEAINMYRFIISECKTFPNDKSYYNIIRLSYVYINI